MSREAAQITQASDDYERWRVLGWEAKIGMLRAVGLFDSANRLANEVHARVRGYLTSCGEQEFFRRLALYSGSNSERRY